MESILIDPWGAFLVQESAHDPKFDYKKNPVK